MRAGETDVSCTATWSHGSGDCARMQTRFSAPVLRTPCGASFDARTRGFHGARKIGARVRADLARLYDTYLPAHTGCPGERIILLEAHLRKPQPQVAGAG